MISPKAIRGAEAELASKFLRRTTLVLIFRVLGAVAAYGLNVQLARIMPLDEFGRYGWLSTMALTAGTILTFGLVDTNIRSISAFHAEKRVDLIYPMFQWSRVVVLIGSSFGAVTLLTLAHLFAHQDINLESFAASALVIVIIATSEIYGAFFRGFDRILMSSSREVAWRLIAIAAIAAIYFGKSIALSTSSVMVIMAGSLFLVLAVQFIVLKRILRPFKEIGNSVAKSEGLVRAASAFWLWNSFIAALKNVDVVAVGLLFTPADAAVYFAASRIASLASFFVNAGAIVGAREISSLYYQGDQATLKHIILRSTSLMFILVTTSSIGLYLGAPYLLAMFGHDFLPGHVILAIILTFQVISSVFGLSTTVLGATGEENFLYKLPIYGVLFYFVMQTGTIPLGILSVPVSLGLTLVFINGLAAVRVSRTLGFDISIFGVLKEFWSIQKTR